GGMAVVFKAKDRSLGRFVAVKILRPEYTQDESFIESFLRESQLVAGIVDPNIVQVYDVGQEGNIHYIVMELVEGETLSEIITREGKLDAHTVVSYGKQIASALRTAHANMLIHRDIKPHNIMVTYDGVAKLTDFGIAKRANPNQEMSGDEKEAVMGSIHYFSPEQARGIPVDGRTDIYSLGIVMYEMITGRVPFDGENAVEVAVKHMNEPMIPPSKFAFDMPQDLEDIILKATDKNPDHRYSSADDMIVALNLVKYSKLVKYEPEPLPEEEGFTRSVVAETEEEEGKPIKFWQKSFSITVALIIALIPLVWGLFDVFVDSIKERNKTIVVPNLFEKNYDDAKAMLEAQGLQILLDSELVNDNYEEGTILSQSPKAESVVRPGTTIKVNVSKKNPGANVPEVRNMELSEAKKKIENYGLTVGSVTEMYSDTVKKGCVISTSPVVGTNLKRGTPVNINVSKGPSESSGDTFSMNVVGLKLEDAIKALASKGCTYTVSYREDYSSGIDRGCVLSQNPSEYDEVTVGTEFELVVRAVIAEGESTIKLHIDLAGFDNGDHYIAIIVTDNYANEGGITQWPREKFRKTFGMSSIDYDIHGKGKGSAVVVIDNTTISYTVDFDNGTVERKN
ncbi:MAG: Stk1 family PASTA domain-containing Ser/Thr kinase, partial [Firmicutes bacterium]|nr:Stk1 family PASTA domain-containing Ser/Thr kinase [Bacillota bacterium]